MDKHGKSISIRNLADRGFPDQVVGTLLSRGFRELNPIQCASMEAGLLNGKNQLIIAPTSSGKTLIAELATIYHALHRKSVFYLVSLKALAEEKYILFRRFWSQGEEQLLRTAITTGDRDFEDEGLSQCQVTFATYEKFYALIRDYPDLLSHVSLIVVDELQTLGEKNRGYVLEMLLTLVRIRNPQIQIVGLSAALPNADEVGAWLDATVCRTTTRDIPLVQEIWTQSTVYSRLFGSGDEALQQRRNPTSSTDTHEIIIQAVANKETPIIVFCMTKQRTEDLARQHYERIRRGSGVRKILHDLKQLVLSFTEGGPTGRSLTDVIDAGIAFHHSDLSLDERQVIEDKIRDGTIEVTYSTTTLGQGVNLPIATVIFDDVYRRWIETYIDKREYINMAGRAGRRGFQEEKGTAILISRTARDRVAINRYINEEAEVVESTLENAPFDAVLLNLVASRDAADVDGLKTFISNSLFGVRTLDKNPALLKARLDAIRSITDQLIKDGFMILTSEGQLKATPLGQVTSQKGITPKTALNIIRRIRILTGRLSRSGDEFLSAAEKLLPGTIHLLLDADGDCGLAYPDRSAASFLQDYVKVLCTLRAYEEPNDPLLTLQSAWVLNEWIKGTGYQAICNPFKALREGQIKHAGEHCSWMFDTAASIGRTKEYGLDPRIPAHLAMTAKRLLFGVPEGGVAISDVIRNRVSLDVNLRGIGRGKVMDVVNAGYDDLTKIIEADPSKLSGLLRDPEKARNLQLAAARYIDRLSQSSLAMHSLRSKRFSQDELIKRLYTVSGTQFEAAVLELLAAVGVKAQLLDDRKIQGCADISVSTASGNIQMECKTRERGLVTNSEAFEVLGKTVVGSKPIGFVTVGKPGFVDVAIKNSYVNKVTLINHKALAEMAILIWEKKKSADDLLRFLLSSHYVDKSDL